MITYDLINFDSEGRPCKVLDMLAHNGEYLTNLSILFYELEMVL